MFTTGNGDWVRYRKLGPHKEIDLHYNELGRRDGSYDEAMDHIREVTLRAVKEAHEEGTPYVIFTHGKSTSRPGKTTARSVVRGLMRSNELTPYIIRKECIQHESVFVAVIRKNANQANSSLSKM